MARRLTTKSTYVTSTVTKILDPTGGDYVTNPRERLVIINTGANVAYVGEANTVTTANGFPVYPVNLTNGVIHEFELEKHSGALYAICAAAETATLKTIEQFE